MDLGTYWPSCSSEKWMGKLSWSELGTIYQLLELYHCGLFIDTEIGKGDLLPWIQLKVLHSTCKYLGICLDGTEAEKGLLFPMDITNFTIVTGSCHSKPIQYIIESQIEKTKEAAFIFCGNGQIERSFKTYADLARPGDLICAWGFPVSFHLSVFDNLKNDGKIRRIKEKLQFDRLIVGVIL